MLTFGGRFEGHFEFIFGYVSSHFRRLRRALGVLLRLSRNDFERLSDYFEALWRASGGFWQALGVIDSG